MSSQLPTPGALNLGTKSTAHTHCIGGCVGPEQVWMRWRRENLGFCWEPNPDRPVILLTELSYLVALQYRMFVLCRFFEANPSHQKHFKSFKDVPLKDLPSNPKFQAHCTSVMYALTSVVDNLDDTECLIEMLTKLGQNHQRHGISRQEFIVSSNDSLQDLLGRSHTSTRQFYLYFLSFIWLFCN
jgi:hypothetical protein